MGENLLKIFNEVYEGTVDDNKVSKLFTCTKDYAIISVEKMMIEEVKLSFSLYILSLLIENKFEDYNL